VTLSQLLISLLVGLHLVTAMLAIVKGMGRLPLNSWWIVPSPTFLSWGLAGALRGSMLGMAVLVAAVLYGAWAWMKTPSTKLP
jgi:hypothetical protein